MRGGGSDLRADRPYWPRSTYDLNVKLVASEMRPYQPHRCPIITLVITIEATLILWTDKPFDRPGT